MKIILLQNVPKVGNKYDIKEINDGYATNFLFPKKMAVPATAKAVAELEQRKKNIAIEREVQNDLLDKNLEELKNATVTIRAKADDKGHLFSAIHAKMLAQALDEEGPNQIDEKFISLEKQIKEAGEFEIPVVIRMPSGIPEKKSSFKLIVEKV